ncbi:hypothetical protein MSG28_010004 [Choristoneura fumiferana]|uniref:Uncharacterized protein n=1 Tax=Choristoneura fumiferana TaxID=7141 RepID=A0ACC0KIS1_CHOFU|nr:hypothetical protein MSG28_010004 [Choristoneura fumiferana]
MSILKKEKEYEKVPTKELINEKGYIARAHLGVSIVAMTNMERVKNMNSMVNSNVTINDTFKNVIETIRLNIINATDAVELRVNETSFEDEEPVKSIWNVFRTYDWSKPVQEMILGAFFVGYCLMMFPTGIACQRYGGKLPLQMCLLINGIISIATPTVAVWSGLLSSLPYVACAFATMGYGVLSDFCTNRGYLSLKAARIICNTLAQAGPALCLVAVSYTDDSALAVFLLIVALGLYAGIHSGWMVNYIDLAPNFSGSLLATGNTFSTLLITNQKQWRIIMFLMAGMIFFSNALFVFFIRRRRDKPKVSIPSSYGYGMRHVQSCLLFLCVTVAYMARAHLGVSVVAMTRPNDKHNTTNIIDNNETAIVNVKETGMELNATGEIMFKNESIDVDETSLNNFIISHGERMSEYNNTLEDIVIGNGTDTLWNVYRGGWKAVCACRVLQGVSTTLGTVIAFQLSGLLASSAAGWPSTFWVVGVTCLVAFAMVTLFSAATPSDHKTISEEEKKYIMGAAGSSKTSGFLSSLPYIGSFFFCIAYGVLSDYCVNRGYVTLKTTRIVCNTLDKPKVSIPSSYGYGMRHVQSCLLFLCVTVAYMARAHLGVSVVAMTRPNDKHNTTNIIDNNETAIVNVKETGMELNATGEIIFKNESMDVDETSFHNFIISHGERISEYNNTLEDIVIGNGTDTLWNVYRVNYIDMSPNFSGSLMAVGNTGCGAGVLLLPVLVSNIVTELGGWVLTVIFRIIQGLSQSCIVPSMHTAFGKWTPLEERGRLTSFAYGVPWKKLMRSWGLYAIVVAHTGYNWGNLTLYSEVPAFMDKIMKVNIKANGLLTALPYFVQWFSNFFFSWVTDMIIVKKYLSVTNTRKLANSIGSISSTIGLITLAFVDKDIYVVETILVTICAFSISTNVGYHVNHIDIAPNFAGTLMSISNFVSNCVGSLAPIVAGCILTDVTSEYLWRKVFCVSAGFFFVTNLFYVIFGTAELADWNEPEEEVTKEDEDPMLMKERR